LRIISGKYGSRRIQSSKHSKKCGRAAGLRPTSDRARESLFNILANRLDFEGITCLDLFAGTGSLGFECLSRGAIMCRFVDNDAVSRDLIEKTAKELGCSDQMEFIMKDVMNFLTLNHKDYYDLILADPPYGCNAYEELIGRILKRKFGIFVLEYKRGTTITAEAGARFEIIDRRAGLACFKLFITI
jgi:16S rRNA (guanine(966)-N(2))-methyltransferase RsmD